MDNFNLYEKIEAYLKGELSADVVQAFEQEISQNSDLAEQVALHRLEWDAMEVLIENNLRDKMITWERPQTIIDTPSVSTVVKPLMTVQKGGLFTRYAWAAAASVAILATLALWFFNRPEQKIDNMSRTEQPKNQPISPIDTLEELDGAGSLPAVEPKAGVVETPKNDVKKKDKSLIPPAPNETVPANSNDVDMLAFAETAYSQSDVPNYEDMTASRGNNNNSVLDEAGKAYDQKDCAKTISLLKNTAVTADNFIALDILAHAYFQSKNYRVALPVFQNVLKLSGRRSQEKSEWYLLLCYLANGKAYQTDFEVLAKKIMSNNAHSYFAATTQLFNQFSSKK